MSHEMNLLLPTFKKTEIRAFTACGIVKTDSAKLLEFLKVKSNWVGWYSEGSKKIFLELSTGGKNKKHLHIDCIIGEHYKKESLKKTINDFNKIKSIIKMFYGQKISVSLNGMYILPVNEIPTNSIIQSFLVEKKIGEISMQLRSGTISIEGVPVSEIEWQLSEKKDETVIYLRANKEEKVNEDYLVRINDWIDQLLKSYILIK